MYYVGTYDCGISEYEKSQFIEDFKPTLYCSRLSGARYNVPIIHVRKEASIIQIFPSEDKSLQH
jgi:hypothetical protein